MSSRDSRIDEFDRFVRDLPREQNPLLLLDLPNPESLSSVRSNTGSSDRSNQSFITVDEMQQNSSICEDDTSFNPVANWQCQSRNQSLTPNSRPDLHLERTWDSTKSQTFQLRTSERHQRNHQIYLRTTSQRS